MVECPVCKKELRRVRRKPMDRTISYVIPVHRYMCLNHACRWHGLRFAPQAHPLLKAKQEGQSSKG